MKLHDLDWQAVLRELPRWEDLSLDARRTFLKIEPGKGVHLRQLGTGSGELDASDLLIPPSGRATNHMLDPALRPLLIALRAADRRKPLHQPGGRLRPEYVIDQLDALQSHRIASPGRGYQTATDRRDAANAVSSATWARGFLAAETRSAVVRWEERQLTSKDRPRLVFPAIAQALRALVQALAAHPRGVPLGAVATLVPEAKPEDLAAALAAGLRYLLVFVSMNPAFEAVVGLLPSVAVRLAGNAPPPVPVETRETFAAPLYIGDMTAVLVEAATEPIAIRAADRSLYVRAQRAITARLATVPAWVEHFATTGRPDADEEDYGPHATPAEAAAEAAALRVAMAVHLATVLRLASVKSTGDRLQLEATPDGRAWLGGGEGERLRHVLAALRALPQRMPSAYGGSGELDFFGAELGFQLSGALVDARVALTAAFLSTPPGALVPLDAFLRYHAQANNPFVGPNGPVLRGRSFWGNEPTTTEGWEDTWAALLVAFLARRLAPLGGATLGRMDDKSLAFGLTDAGRYLLGERDEFALPPEPGGSEVVVQPDFEIVFLAPAPRAEAELGRIAERTGAGVGALFRLTRASVLRAAEQGMSAAQVLQALESVSRGGVPANVARQVGDWMKSVRSIRIAPAVLIDCPDAETAARVRALGGAHVTPVTSTLLRLDADAKTRAALVKRLREKGIFVATGDDGASAPRPRPGRPKT